MRTIYASSLAVLFLCGCPHPRVERGRPEALRPILGGGALGAGLPRTKPEQPVADFAMDLGPLSAAWPRARTELPRLLRAVIARGSWGEPHRQVAVADGVLRVRHRPEVVQQARRLVQGLVARVLAPVQVQVVLAELDVGQVGRALVASSGGPGWRWHPRAFAAAQKGGGGRVLARAVLGGTNGQWMQADALSNQVFVSGFDVDQGTVRPRSTTLASGFTVQAAAWRRDEQQAVLALTGLYTGPAKGGPVAQQTIHRLLPSEKSYERKWEVHQVKLDLPLRDMVEVQSQLTLRRGDWTVVAVLPRARKRLVVAVARVDWEPPPELAAIKTFSSRGYGLTVIPVALPVDSRVSPRVGQGIANRAALDSSVASRFRQRARKAKEQQKKHTYNFQAESGGFDLSMQVQRKVMSKSRSSLRQQLQSRGGPGAAPGMMPAEIERLHLEVLQADWPEGTALEYMANHVFVVHSKALTRKLARLLELTHAWRNRQVQLELAFPLLDARTADALGGARVTGKRLTALLAGTSLLPRAALQVRPGGWAEAFAGQMHSVLRQAWPADSSSPQVAVYWRGVRITARPQLNQGQQPLPLELRWVQHRLQGSEPKLVAGALVQQPQDAVWRHVRQLQLRSGEGMLTGIQGGQGALPALLLRASVR